MVDVKRRTPSGRIAHHRVRERNAPARCARCRRELHGVPALSSFQLSKISKTNKRPERPYGGYYCGNCTKELFRERARSP